MKRKILIILIITFLIILFGILMLCKINYKDSKNEDSEISKINDIIQEDFLENIIDGDIILEDIDEKDINNEITFNESENKIEEKSVLNNSEKEVINTNKTNNVVIMEDKKKETVETKPVEKENTNNILKNEEKVEVVKQETHSEKNVENNIKIENESKKNEPIVETPKCNHSNETYYDTEDEAIAFYKKTSKEYGNKVKNGEITYEEYVKKCPYGYETITCPYCQKWKISFYYQ